MKKKVRPIDCLVILMLICLVCSTASLAVTSNITRHKTSEDLLKGETEDVIITSIGTIQLGTAAEALVEEFEDVWSINAIVVSSGTVFVGTSPNGGIYKYSLGELKTLYQAESSTPDDTTQNTNEPNDPNQPVDVNTVETQQHLANEHIFAMATDISGRLLAGISGDNCRLMRLNVGEMETIFEPNDAEYIFAIAVGINGDIYLGTGPEGKIYKLDSFAKTSELLYDSPDKNILSLAVGDSGFIYAGSDTRGLVYKIDPQTKTATVLYDSDQEEITSLLFGEDGTLYAAATSANIVQAQTQFAYQHPLAGRPEFKAADKKSSAESKGSLQLKIANTPKGSSPKGSAAGGPPIKPPAPGKASHIYKISDYGFVTDIFAETAVFFSMAEQKEKLLIGTGNKAQLFSVAPAMEEQAIIYENTQASQITAVVTVGDDIFIGTANPAKLLKLTDKYAAKGTYTSDLIDAGQPTKWGKLQIDADIPQNSEVLMSSRSGNVKDINDPTFSQWTEPVKITEPVQMLCPLGRFAQYKLTLKTTADSKTPVIREVAVANTIPNLPPKVKLVTVEPIKATGKTGFFKITYKAKDDNNDKLIYKIDFRKTGRTNWIEIEDEIEKPNFEWDGKTVEDSRYEIRVTASDIKSNTSETKLTSTRISESVVVDNTTPVIEKLEVTDLIKNGKNLLQYKIKVSDALSSIAQLQYTVDSNADWTGTVPEDSVYDTAEEYFTITLEELEKADHILTLKATDAVGNTAYKTFEITVDK